ncbi:MAG: chemotaxis protein, partial [Methylobacterium sp.]|nr:chemotaxis protein [Methylobacterium sp.]
MSGQLGLMIELIVGGLLVVTIGYCVLLDRRLRAMRADETVIRKTINDLSM